MHAFANGDPAGARARLVAAVDPEDSLGAGLLPQLPFDVTDPVLLMRIARAADDDRLAQIAITVADRRRDANLGVESIGAVAAQVRGLFTESCDALADAAARWTDGPRPLASASAHEDHAVALVQRGATGRGAEVLGDALEIYAVCGAAWDAARVRRRLRRLGVRRRLSTPARPTSGWAGLTDAELAVVRLVATGLKNREVAEQLFISPHTVSMHLRHSFTKLDINSRVELSHFVFTHESAA
jgi:DNA-binding CsgD family transcriptional regulator